MSNNGWGFEAICYHMLCGVVNAPLKKLKVFRPRSITNNHIWQNTRLLTHSSGDVSLGQFLLRIGKDVGGVAKFNHFTQPKNSGVI